MFSAAFLTFLVYLALTWCAVASAALLAMLVRDILQGTSW